MINNKAIFSERIRDLKENSTNGSSLRYEIITDKVLLNNLKKNDYFNKIGVGRPRSNLLVQELQLDPLIAEKKLKQYFDLSASIYINYWQLDCLIKMKLNTFCKNINFLFRPSADDIDLISEDLKRCICINHHREIVLCYDFS